MGIDCCPHSNRMPTLSPLFSELRWMGPTVNTEWALSEHCSEHWAASERRWGRALRQSESFTYFLVHWQSPLCPIETTFSMEAIPIDMDSLVVVLTSNLWHSVRNDSPITFPFDQRVVDRRLALVCHSTHIQCTFNAYSMHVHYRTHTRLHSAPLVRSQLHYVVRVHRNTRSHPMQRIATL